ncbi:MAG: HEAT repeat domain-containing protein [Thermoanaerobaculia bacterium]
MLAVAWKNISAYPPGHPTFVASLNDAHRKLAEAAALGGTVTLGIGRDALFIADEKIDSTQARKFAEALYRHGVAIVSVDRAVEAWELEMLFRFAAGDPRPGRALWDEIAAAGIQHVALTPVDYSAVRATDEVDGEAEEKPKSLFEDILKAILSGRELSEVGATDLEEEAITAKGVASVLLHYLDTGETSERGGAGAPDRGSRDEIVDLIIEKVAAHIDRAAGETRQVTMHQIADLLRNLPREIQERVLHSAVTILATDPSAEEELRTLARLLAPDEILHALSAVRHEGVRLSSHALRLLQGLMMTATVDTPDMTTVEDEARELAAQISTLLGNEDIDRFNPPEHKQLLQDIDLEIPASDEGPRERALELGRERLATLEDENIAQHVQAALLEMIPRQPQGADLEAVFVRIEEHFLELLGTMQMTAALELVDTIQVLTRDPAVPPHVQAAAAASLERIGTGDAIQVLVDWLHLASDELIPQIRRIIDLFGTVGTRNFLYALAEENDRSRRRRLFDFLAGLGPVIVPDAIQLLGDRRWYVVRNMITLLRSVGDRKSLPEIRKLTAHADIRVRLEAIKSLLTFESRLPIDLIEKAIRDPDPKLAESAVALCGSYEIVEAEGPLLRIVMERDWFGRRKSIRLKSLHALAELGRPETLERLDPILRERRFSLRDPEERRYAYELLEYYPVEARARWVEHGLTSRDAAIRAISAKLSRSTAIATTENTG